ncbi:MAG: DUF1800 family protein [Bacteroidota bacterium]
MKQFCISLLICLPVLLYAQEYRHYDYLGAGHTRKVLVTSSSSTTGSSTETVDGFIIQNPEQLKDASRFLAQCTFGADFSTIQMTAAMGYEAWLDEQFSLPQPSMLDEMYRYWNLYNDDPELRADRGFLPDHMLKAWFQMAWFNHNLTTPDLLRNRMAFILSQIMVINNGTELLEEISHIGTTYYEMLGDNAFKNYRTLLSDVTLSPAMGIFLSHYNNPKADPDRNIHPDENYAREIMQLFSIGLWELNADGTRKVNESGEFIPTYTNADIKEFAQVFTGLGPGTPDDYFGLGIDVEFEGYSKMAVYTRPMKMYDQHHDKSEKRLLKGTVLPAGQSGMQDLNQSLDHLARHANTAPFISKALMQFMTTSNPSPGYVSRVSKVFDPFETDNFQRVIKAILLDPEARVARTSDQYLFGKLREPLVRYMNYLRALPLAANENGDYVFDTDFVCLANDVGQLPLEARSVFNFFRPDYQAQGPIIQQYFVSPEFQLLTSTNSIALVNEMDRLAIRRLYMEGCIETLFEEEPWILEELESLEEGYFMDYSYAESLAARDPSALIDHLDILLANGLLKPSTKATLEQAIVQLDDPFERVRMAMYLTMISPDYVILR